jgi:hypothetical protein
MNPPTVEPRNRKIQIKLRDGMHATLSDHYASVLSKKGGNTHIAPGTVQSPIYLSHYRPDTYIVAQMRRRAEEDPVS